MTTPAGRGGNGDLAASGVAELGAEALAARTSYGEGALVASDRFLARYLKFVADFPVAAALA